MVRFLIAEVDMPSFSSRPVTSVVCSTTPMEPVTVPSRARMRSAASATMYPAEVATCPITAMTGLFFATLRID